MRGGPLQNVHFEPIGEAWGKYFPSVPKDQRETFEYPEPLCPAFWKSYSEPVQEIIREVEDLYQAVAFFARPLDPSCMLWENAGAGLAATAAPTQRRLRIDPERNEVVAEWAFPSLLSMIAFNAIERVADRAVRLCEHCHALFSSNDRTAKYCGKACREVQQKRNQREAKRKVGGGEQ